MSEQQRFGQTDSEVQLTLPLDLAPSLDGNVICLTKSMATVWETVRELETEVATLVEEVRKSPGETAMFKLEIVQGYLSKIRQNLRHALRTSQLLRQRSGNGRTSDLSPTHIALPM